MPNRYSLLYLTFFILSLSLYSFAQVDSTKTKTKEYYLTFSNFSPLSIQLQFKKQLSKKTYFRLSLVNLSYNEAFNGSADPNLFPTNQINYSGGIQLGIEFRKPLAKKFALFHGPNLRSIYNLSVTKYLDPAVPSEKQKNKSETLQVGIPYTLGIMFNITPNILIATEINPSINYNYNWYTNGQNSFKNYGSGNISVGFDNRYALLSLVFRL